MSDGKVSLVFGADAGNVPQVVGQINAKLQGMAAAGESAGAGVSRGLTAAGGAAGTAGTKFDRLAKAAGPLGGVLARISPEAGAAASSLAGLTGTAEAMAAGLGVSLAAAGAAMAALTVILGTGYLAWRAYNEESDRDVAILKLVGEAREKLQPLFDAEAAALVRLRVLNGELTEAEAKTLLDRTAGHKTLVKSLEGTTKVTSDLRKEEGTFSRELADAAEGFTSFNGATMLAARLIDGVTTSSSEAAVEVGKLADEQKKLIGDSKNSIDVIAKASEEEEKRRKKEQAAAAARAKREKEALDAEAERRKEQEDADAADKRATEERDARMKREDDANTERAKKRFKKWQEEEQRKKAASEAELVRIAEEERAATEALQARLSTAASVTGSLTGLMTQLNDQQLDSIDTSTQAGREAAKQQWEQNKGAAFAMSVVQAALGVAIASASAPPPLNIPAIIQSTVAGAVATAAIAAAPPPKFHAGTARVDEVNATLKKGEAVLSTQGVSAAGRDAVGRWNSGRDSGQTTPAVVMQYRHQVFNRFIRDNLRMNTPLSAAVKRGSVGFRDRV